MIRFSTLLILLSCVRLGSTGAESSSSGSELWKAIERGNTAQVESLIHDGASINARDDAGNTLLIHAALYSHAGILRTLLKAGADVNATNRAGVNALVRGAADVEKVKLLVAAGAEVNRMSRLGNTALILAARSYGSLPSLQLLVGHGANVNATNHAGVTALMAAAAADDAQAVAWLLRHGADARAKPGPAFFLGGQRTPLAWAAHRGNLAMVRDLLDHGAPINEVVAFGTALHQAMWAGHADVAKLLLERGADTSLREPFSGYAPIHWAASVENGDPALVNLLLKRGADPNVAGGQEVSAFMGKSRTPLDLADLRGQTPVVNALTAGRAKFGEGRQTVTPVSLKSVDEPLTDGVLRTAVEKSLALLQRTADQSRAAFLKHASKQDCVSCHQQYLPMAAVGYARRKAVMFDAEAAKKQITLALFTRAIDMHLDSEYPDEITLQATFHPEPVFSYAYALFALDAEAQPASSVTDAMVHHLASIQGKDGEWHNNLPRPPMQSSDISATALALHGLRAFPLIGRQREIDQRVERARKWLAVQKPEFTEERVFQLLGLSWAGESRTRLDTLARQLGAKQRKDGGWAQLDSIESDAYATGQALFALHEAGQMKADDPVWQRGIKYLLQTQIDDGSWRVRRRAFPFQPTMESGFPHGRDSWISAAGSSWAVMALSFGLDRSQSYRNPNAVASRDKTAAQLLPKIVRTTPVSYANEIKPFLEKSCFGCHSGRRPSAGFGVDSPENLRKSGESGLPAIIPGASQRSRLIQFVADLAIDSEMPPMVKRTKYPALTIDQIALLRAWIDQGAR